MCFRKADSTPLTGRAALRARGYVSEGSLTLGGPCRAAANGGWFDSGRYRPECNAQAHAIRKLNSIARNERGDYAYNPRVQWEVGPAPDRTCADDDDEACEPAQREYNATEFETKVWRADIVSDLALEGELGGPWYGLYEVKRFRSTTTYSQVNSQMQTYEDNMRLRNMLVRRGRQLQEANGGRGWAVYYFDGCLDDDGTAPGMWFAWAPVGQDEDGLSVSDSNLAGHLYFRKADNINDIPPHVRSRAVQGDADYQDTCEVDIPDGPGIVKPPIRVYLSQL